MPDLGGPKDYDLNSGSDSMDNYLRITLRDGRTFMVN